MITKVKDRELKSPLGIEYRPPTQKIVRLSKIQQMLRAKPLMYGAIALMVALSITVASVKVMAPSATSTVAKQEELPIDTASILAGSESSLEALRNQTMAQLEQYREQLLSAKADRFLAEARRQVDDKASACFMQSLACPLDQFQRDAIQQLEAARVSGDYDGLLTATDRVFTVEYARSNRPAAGDPPHSLAQVAVDNLVAGYERNEAATAEAQAAELIKPAQ